jgi:hypothetical protein
MSTIQETRSAKVFAAKCPEPECDGQGKISSVSEVVKVDQKTGEKTQRRYVTCGTCGHRWAQDGPPARDKPVGEFIAGPCELHTHHGEGRIYTKNTPRPHAVCDQCGHTWRALRKVE